MSNLPYVEVSPIDVNTDLHPMMLDAGIYTGGQNIRFRDDRMQSCKGYLSLDGMPSHDFEYLLGFRDAGFAQFILAGVNDISRYVTGAVNDITPDGGINKLDNKWTGGVLNGIPFISTPSIDPLYLNLREDSKMQYFPGWPEGMKAQIIRPYKNYLIALDIENAEGSFPNMIWWSASTDAGSIPQSWDITDPTNDAGNSIIAAEGDRLVDCLPMREFNILYKNNSCYVMQFTGDRFIFSFRELFTDVGVMTKDCVVEVMGQHVLMTEDDIIMHDGNSYNSIAKNRVRNQFMREINQDARDTCFVVKQERENEVWFCFPVKGSPKPNRAIIWNYKHDKFGFQDLPLPDAMTQVYSNLPTPDGLRELTWDTDEGTWDEDQNIWSTNDSTRTTLRLLMVQNNQVFIMDEGDSFDGAEIDSYIERVSLDSGDPNMVKLYRRMYPMIETIDKSLKMFVRIGTQMSYTDTIQWGHEIEYDPNNPIPVDFIRKGRFFSFRFRKFSKSSFLLWKVGIEATPHERY